jgi:hypothetical protein
MGSKESLLRNKYKKQPFQKPQLVFYLLTCYIWLSIYIWDCGGKRRRRRRREGEDEKRTYPRGARKMVVERRGEV